MAHRTVQTLLALLCLTLAAEPVAAQSARGTGQRATELFRLPEGLATFEIRYEGIGPFSVRLLDERGMLVEQLAAAEGPWEGSRAVRIPRSGRYLYDVGATGAWSVQLREPAAAPAAGTGDGAEQGRWEGMAAAKGLGTVAWMGTGLLGGMVAGPVGLAVNYGIAASRPLPMPADSLLGPRGSDPVYREAFIDAYRARIRSNRRTAALVGGLTGTAVFAFVLLQVIHWDGANTGGGGGGGGELP